MRLYAEHVKPIPIHVEAAPEGVDIVACASEDRAAVCVFAVNIKDAPAEIALNLSEIAARCRLIAAHALFDRLDQRQPDVMNHWTAPDRVAVSPLRIQGNTVALLAFSATAIECGSR